MIDGLWGNIFRKAKKGEDNVLSMLKIVPILDGLSRDELKEFERIVHQRHYVPNENIFWEGEPGVGMYIIQEGAVKIYKTLSDGNDKELAILKNGDFFGELALLDESPRSASAVALETSHILGLFRPEFFDILERKPKLGLKVTTKLAQMIGNRLRITNTELQSLCAKFHKPEKLSKMTSDEILPSDLDKDETEIPKRV
ncbi:MAG TPA: cyclic nucleotide-binding domain-containing protein [Candidatus Wunengus sp. YC60]|uniref:cyclic nucleotide-binding domain-containing protein n=1 Tax=Candidatus Wunengus sp. YC60 TaxID=3367697 RepID=UPI004025B495